MNRFVWVVAFVCGTACSSGGSGSGDGGGAAGTSGAGTGGACTSANTGKGCFGSCNACTLLTVAQVSTAVGVTVGTPDGSDPHNCDWSHDDASGIPDLQVIVGANVNAMGFHDICHPKALPDAGLTVTAVSGVGDDACFVRAQGIGGPILNFIEGCWAYSIAIEGLATTATTGLSDATIEADEKALALAALPNL